jgi:O-acetyl-ADP-ribose deacetylase (regulator of RNase III)
VPLGDRLQIVQADITTLDVDAIVNAANVALMPVVACAARSIARPGPS